MTPFLYNQYKLSSNYPQTFILKVKKWVPNLEIEYAPDARQAIADSWPMVFDDSLSRQEWGWQHHIDLSKLVEIMITNLRREFEKKATLI